MCLWAQRSFHTLIPHCNCVCDGVCVPVCTSQSAVLVMIMNRAWALIPGQEGSCYRSQHFTPLSRLPVFVFTLQHPAFRSVWKGTWIFDGLQCGNAISRKMVLVSSAYLSLLEPSLLRGVSVDVCFNYKLNGYTSSVFSQSSQIWFVSALFPSNVTEGFTYDHRAAPKPTLRITPENTRNNSQETLEKNYLWKLWYAIFWL